MHVHDKIFYNILISTDFLYLKYYILYYTGKYFFQILHKDVIFFVLNYPP